eukprot:CAMPEP_0173171944 /NCGR_PEP_ID=MMETSP1141-20130122/2036_1 /TAXON_ID=483371 /ORGANISM="non described non described, Strain CCMP2298" /LENGTH=186 /DNA_ID=CAMNT_0014093929 /DNA_START=140 /DNA_END=700 /DNA_ORIENTATION=-
MISAFRHPISQASFVRTLSRSAKGMVAYKSQSANGVDLGTIDLLYDSDCPICRMEVAFLKKRDVGNRIKFTDLSAADYDASQHGNVAFERGMRKIRAVMPEGEVVTGMEVFRQTYNAIGLGWVFAVTQLPVVGSLADYMYDLWAENRLRITGRGEMADMLRERAEALKNNEEAECDTDACEIDWDE